MPNAGRYAVGEKPIIFNAAGSAFSTAIYIRMLTEVPCHDGKVIIAHPMQAAAIRYAISDEPIKFPIVSESMMEETTASIYDVSLGRVLVRVECLSVPIGASKVEPTYA